MRARQAFALVSGLALMVPAAALVTVSTYGRKGRFQMMGELRNRSAILRIAALLGLLSIAGMADVSASQATASSPANGANARHQSCNHLERFDDADFPDRPRIRNRFLPFVPGTQMTLEGNVEGVPHRVDFIVTDLTKEMDDVNTLVVWDTDRSEGEIVETELSFFAQDSERNVWNLGEYPEEFEDGEFNGAPSTWITGEDGAKAGIHMPARRPVSPRQYVQGFAPAIDFLDCASIVDKDVATCVRAGCFDEVLVTNETNQLDPEDDIQVKLHAPGVGIIGVGSLDASTGETLELVEVRKLSLTELRQARTEALRFDRRGYQFGGDAYQATEPATRLRH